MLTLQLQVGFFVAHPVYGYRNPNACILGLLARVGAKHHVAQTVVTLSAAVYRIGNGIAVRYCKRIYAFVGSGGRDQ